MNKKNARIYFSKKSELLKGKPQEIQIRITKYQANGKPVHRYIRTGFSTAPSYYNSVKNEILKKHPQYTQIKSKIDDIFDKELPRLASKKRDGDFLQFWESEIENEFICQRFGNAKNYKKVLKDFRIFLSNKYGNKKNGRVDFSDITKSLLNDYNTYIATSLKQDGSQRKASSNNQYRKITCAIINKCENIDLNPNQILKKGKVNTTPKALNKVEFTKVYMLAQQGDEGAKVFMLMCIELHGIRVGDFLSLRFSNIDGKKIIYHPRKTTDDKDQLYEMKIEINDTIYDFIKDKHKNHFEKIDNKLSINDQLNYLAKMNPNEFLFGYLEKEKCLSAYDLFKQIDCKKTKINRLLKITGNKINKHITSHMARHTFATTFMREIDIKTLKDMLGHRKIATTDMYLSSLENDEWGEKISQNKVGIKKELFDSGIKLKIDQIRQKMSSAK